MNADGISGLAKAIVDLALFLEFADQTIMDEDASIEAMEQLAHNLQSMDVPAQQQFAKAIRALSANYEGEQKTFIEEFPENFGLAGT